MNAIGAFLFAVISLFAAPPAPSVQPNDNLRSAGQEVGGVLTVRLYAAVGSWHPKGAAGAGVDAAAFGEEGSGLSTPGPLIRARAGTTVALTLRNDLESSLTVFGLCPKPGPCDPVAVPAGASRDIRFALKTAGTYHYWASRTARTITSRPAVDSQLGGAIVVDPADAAAADRVMVVSVYEDGPAFGGCTAGPDTVLAINGASWPHTPRMKYAVGEAVRFRVINLSCEPHAMHLHGFHFAVEAAGDGQEDRLLPGENKRTAVTEVVTPGRTFALEWTPTRAGNWLFHCHMVAHMARPTIGASAHHEESGDAGMAGLVVGIEVTGGSGEEVSAAERRFSLVLREEADRYGKNHPGYRVDVEGADAPRLDPGPVPGPVLLLRRGEPTEITVVNRTTQPTAIHWHGIELDSYFDGVPGFGGRAGRLAPPIEPGRSFVAAMTPPRAGTFIYHTHWHDEAQLAGGMYGPLIVLEPGEKYDPAIDHIVVIGLNGKLDEPREPFAINGRSEPAPIRMRAGAPNRLRFINITGNNVSLTVSLVSQLETMQWTPVAKDGADLPANQAAPRPARQLVGVGETYDFQITPPRPQNLWLELRRGSGEWVLQAPIEVR